MAYANAAARGVSELRSEILQGGNPTSERRRILAAVEAKAGDDHLALKANLTS
ncbi:hypothetical protein [Mycolicibacterium sp. P9-64]|uniref:hypothetical protein n=1 Tax=Mycolicibacterium sp. P9-64 TaxID=2024612 RepID=UPI001566AC91|nr:hypothetical protein [Mycolicibacterium sp. P9-64]